MNMVDIALVQTEYTHRNKSYYHGFEYMIQIQYPSSPLSGCVWILYKDF